MIAFRVVNRRTKPCDLYVGRPTPWGNPFRVVFAEGRVWQVVGPCTPSYIFRDRYMAHVWAVSLYRHWLTELPQRGLLDRLAQKVEKLRRCGRREVRLGCWCAPIPCHADVLAEAMRQRFGSYEPSEGVDGQQ
jgi:hypothetical protein